MQKIGNYLYHRGNIFGFKRLNFGFLTFQIVQGISQHFKYGYIQRITEGLVVQMKTRTQLQMKKQKCVNDLEVSKKQIIEKHLQ